MIKPLVFSGLGRIKRTRSQLPWPLSPSKRSLPRILVEVSASLAAASASNAAMSAAIAAVEGNRQCIQAAHKMI